MNKQNIPSLVNSDQQTQTNHLTSYFTVIKNLNREKTIRQKNIDINDKADALKLLFEDDDEIENLGGIEDQEEKEEEKEKNKNFALNFMINEQISFVTENEKIFNRQVSEYNKKEKISNLKNIASNEKNHNVISTIRTANRIRMSLNSGDRKNSFIQRPINSKSNFSVNRFSINCMDFPESPMVKNY